MEFEKTVTFLGTKEMKLRDGTVLVTINFYVDNSPVEVNVQASNDAIMSVVGGLSFADTCTATFALRKTDKLYRLSLAKLA